MNKKLDTPVLDGLIAHRNMSNTSFHMPGHKGKYIKEYEILKENLLDFDVTELDDTDDLYNAEGFLKKALLALSDERKSKQSIFLTNGSTVGILSSIMGLANEKDLVLMEEACHKSVYNAVNLKNLQSIIIKTKYDENKIPLPTTENILIENINNNPNIKFVVISRPNYYGLSMDITNLSKICKMKNIYLIVDEAHGSHLSYSDKNTKSAMELGASVSINSFHKTLPAFTQTSVLNLSDNLTDFERRKILSMVEKLQSSSPSYLLMASIDIARSYIKNYGDEKLDILFDNISDFSKKVDTLNNISIYKNFSGFSHDFTRPVLICNNPKDLEIHLQNNNIFIEMIGEKSLVLVSTLMDEKADFENLFSALSTYKEKSIINTNYNQKDLNILTLDKGVLVPLSKSENYISLENIIPYPPGNIYIKKGDKITKENILHLESLINSHIHIYKDFYKDINYIFCKKS